MKRRILLAEDDPGLAQVIKICLESAGRYRVTVVNNGQEALKEALSTPSSHDLLILDELMPHLHGQEICTKLRHKGDQRPLILLSAKEIDVSHCGANAFIEKPFDPRQLPSQVDLIIQRFEGSIRAAA